MRMKVQIYMNRKFLLAGHGDEAIEKQYDLKGMEGRCGDEP